MQKNKFWTKSTVFILFLFFVAQILSGILVLNGINPMIVVSAFTAISFVSATLIQYQHLVRKFLYFIWHV